MHVCGLEPCVDPFAVEHICLISPAVLLKERNSVLEKYLLTFSDQ